MTFLLCKTSSFDRYVFVYISLVNKAGKVAYDVFRCVAIEREGVLPWSSQAKPRIRRFGTPFFVVVVCIQHAESRSGMRLSVCLWSSNYSVIWNKLVQLLLLHRFCLADCPDQTAISSWDCRWLNSRYKRGNKSFEEKRWRKLYAQNRPSGISKPHDTSSLLMRQKKRFYFYTSSIFIRRPWRIWFVYCVLSRRSFFLSTPWILLIALHHQRRSEVFSFNF